jgi:hypothetical protein
MSRQRPHPRGSLHGKPEKECVVADSVADDPKLAPLWDVGQNPQPASKVEARSFRPAVWRCAT